MAAGDSEVPWADGWIDKGLFPRKERGAESKLPTAGLWPPTLPSPSPRRTSLTVTATAAASSLVDE